MKQIDTECPKCKHVVIDVLLREKGADGEYLMPTCQELYHYDAAHGTMTLPKPVPCGTQVRRVYLPCSSASVHGDDIPGGMWIRNGICNPDGSPRRYDTFSSMRQEAKARGLVNYVEHKGTKGGDRSTHTQRFV